VFSLIGTSFLIIINGIVDPDKFIQLADKNEIIPMISTEIDKYFSSAYNETGVPAETYTDYITDDYIRLTVSQYVDSGFRELAGGDKFDSTVPVNKELEESISDFFNDYADSIDYEKDDAFYEKVQETIDSAYTTIGDKCDIYKFSTMSSEGILSKFSPVYCRIYKIMLAAEILSIFLIIMIVLVNIKYIRAVKYWIVISAVISGVIGVVPCIYLNATKYFDSFTIKQTQIFSAFTGLMYKTVNLFMINQIILILAGIVLILLFALVKGKK
jgi:hypothetical protein